jgi:ring-1,2-phenylacetyl-CoA epoxidase subunit PaaC
MSATNAKFEYLLRLGDNALILSQRLSAWCGHGPILEEDLALTNVALDLLGQSRFWLTYAAETEAASRDEDKLAFLRDAGDFRNLLLVEQPNGDYAHTTVRQFFFDAGHFYLLRELTRSKDERIAATAQKALTEVTYHLERSGDWMVRLGDGTAESRLRMQAAVDDLWPFTGEMFEMDEVDREMHRLEFAPDLTALKSEWSAHVDRILKQATLTAPAAGWMQRGGKSGKHTENLGFILAEMQFLQRAYPGAQW